MDSLKSYYQSNNEKERLTGVWGGLEFERSKEIIARYLPKPPAVILDVGGAAGRYSCWLATLGYEVHLIDPMEHLVAQADAASQAQPDHPIASCRVGDARVLEFPDNSADVVLLFGPLYHLTARDDRTAALREAMRVLKPNGVMLGAVISRYASALDGLLRGYVHDPEFRKILYRDLEDGQHRNLTENMSYFTDAYFHLPKEVREEIEHASFIHEATVSVQSVAFMLGDLAEHWEDASKRKILLELLRSLESVEDLSGATAHMIGVGRKPGQ